MAAETPAGILTASDRVCKRFSVQRHVPLSLLHLKNKVSQYFAVSKQTKQHEHQIYRDKKGVYMVHLH